MVANIAFFVFLTGAALVTIAIVVAMLTPESGKRGEMNKLEWLLVSMILGGLAMAAIGFLVFAIAGWVDNTDHYWRSMGVIILTAAAVFLIGFVLNRITTPSSSRAR